MIGRSAGQITVPFKPKRKGKFTRLVHETDFGKENSVVVTIKGNATTRLARGPLTGVQEVCVVRVAGRIMGERSICLIERKPEHEIAGEKAVVTVVSSSGEIVKTTVSVRGIPC